MVAATTNVGPRFLAPSDSSSVRSRIGAVHPVLALEAAAERGDYRAVARGARRLPLALIEVPQVVRVLRLLVAADLPALAREIAARALELHPADADIARWARVLAPPRVLGPGELVEPRPRADALRTWIRAHEDEYRGQWVALADGTLVAAAPTFRALEASIVGDARSLTVLQVLGP